MCFPGQLQFMMDQCVTLSITCCLLSHLKGLSILTQYDNREISTSRGRPLYKTSFAREDGLTMRDSITNHVF